MSGDAKGKTPHGEMTIDQLAGIQPGMSEIMKDVGDRYAGTYYAARGGNWKLAAYQLNGVRTMFRKAKVTRPKFAEDLDAFDAEYLLPVFKAIQAQDWAKFQEAYNAGVVGSDRYHDKRGYHYIRFVLPRDPPSNLYQGPAESFKREPVGQD